MSQDFAAKTPSRTISTTGTRWVPLLESSAELVSPKPTGDNASGNPAIRKPMYKIVGADQKEYGPVSADQVRVNPRSQTQAEGSTDWKLLADLAEYADTLKERMTGPPPADPYALPTNVTTKGKTNGAAVASLVLGIVGFCGVTAVAGLILGIVSLVKINRSQGRLSGRGLAIAGICVSAFMLLFSIPFLAGLTLPRVGAS